MVASLVAKVILGEPASSSRCSAQLNCNTLHIRIALSLHIELGTETFEFAENEVEQCAGTDIEIELYPYQLCVLEVKDIRGSS